MIYSTNNSDKYTIFEMISAIFKDYPDIIDWVNNKIIPTSKRLDYLEDFYKNLLSINKQIIDWEINEEHEELIINWMRDIIKNFDWKYKMVEIIRQNNIEEFDSKDRELEWISDAIDNLL